MDQPPLTACLAAALRDNRIRFGDVRRFERALPEGFADLDEVEMLLALDRAVGKADPAWTDFLVAGVRRFLLTRAAGDLGPCARRVAELIGTRPTRTGAAIRLDLTVELGRIDADLATVFAAPPPRRAVKRNARPAPRMVFAVAPVGDLEEELALVPAASIAAIDSAGHMPGSLLHAGDAEVLPATVAVLAPA